MNHREVSSQSPVAQPDRRTFLKILGLSVAAGALSGCRPPREKIVPYVQQPPEMTPGVPDWYATTCHGCNAACGALVKVIDGRPIKLEGNPDHPLSRGGLCAVGQGVIAGLYDPYRQRRPARRGAPSSYSEADAEVSRHLQAARTGKGSVAILTGGIIGPSTLALINEFLAGFPSAQHVHLDPLPLAAMREGFGRACGVAGVPSMHIDRAKLIVSFGADFLGTWISPVEFAKQYSAGRQNGLRHVQVEARMSLTGSNADRRHVMSPAEQARCAAMVLAAVWDKASPRVAGPPALDSSPMAAIARDLAMSLLDAAGQCLVVSDSDDPDVQTVVAALNAVLGNIGTTLDPARSIPAKGDDASLSRLIGAMQSGEVAVLIIHGCNPAHTWPARREFLSALEGVPCSVATSLVPDETARSVTWHLPAPHPMEAWGDAEPRSGVFSLFQPTIRPLCRTRMLEESLLTWMGRKPDFHAYLQAYWRNHVYPRAASGLTFEAFWDAVLQKGSLTVNSSTTAASSRHGPTPVRADEVAAAAQRISETRLPSDSYEVELCESVALRDGAWANNPWLQELPDPITKTTWGAGASMAPKTADALGLRDGDWIRLPAGDSTIELPIHIQPGQHPRTISIPVGYGRPHAGPVGGGVGVDAYPLMQLRSDRRVRTAVIPSITVARGKEPYRFARTQLHDRQEGRDLARDAAHGGRVHGKSRAAYAEEQRRADLWGGPLPSERQWGMVIDLNRCTGCSACVTACDIENNVPPVGPDEVARNREMHWIRLDRYYEGDADNPRVLHQPMLCQHCANASCESVCPALATVHDEQGLNVQVYNRCVGTRYCANNCPYKVRRFNWFDNRAKLAARRLGLNPSVTVRSRGVMEKCSFCVQRIQAARIRARNEGRALRDGEVQPACQQSCPADAIVFGDLFDRNSRVSQLARDPRGYRVLEELNRQPSITYLAKVAHVLPESNAGSATDGGEQ